MLATSILSFLYSSESTEQSTYPPTYPSNPVQSVFRSVFRLMKNPKFAQLLWGLGCATVVFCVILGTLSSSFESKDPDVSNSNVPQQPRMLISSGSKVSIMGHMKDRYHGSELQSGEDELDVCEDVDETARQLYAMLDPTLSHDQLPQRMLISSESKVSVMGHMKDDYSGSELQSTGGLNLGVCEEDLEALHRNLQERIIANEHEPRHLLSKVSIMGQMKDRYHGSELQETHQLVACSISQANSAILDYYETCDINRCCALEKFVTDFIHQALEYTRYCSLYSDNLNEHGLISVSSNFTGPYLKPGLPTGMKEYGEELQKALSKCESCSANAGDSHLTDLTAVLKEWSEVSLFYSTFTYVGLFIVIFRCYIIHLIQ